MTPQNPHRDPSDGLIRRIDELEAENQKLQSELCAARAATTTPAQRIITWVTAGTIGTVASCFVPTSPYGAYVAGVLFGIAVITWWLARRARKAREKLAISCLCATCSQLRDAGFKKGDAIRVERIGIAELIDPQVVIGVEHGAICRRLRLRDGHCHHDQ